MNDNLNSILIKDKDGKMKTVDLDMIKEDDLITPVKNESEVIKKQEIKQDIPQPLTPETVMPSFYFHLEDEQEAAKFRDKEQVNQKQEQKQTSEYLTDDVIKDSGLELSDSAIKRLKRVADSRFRQVRDLRETKEVLVRALDLGGVGLNDEQAQNILKLIEQHRVKFEEGEDKTQDSINNKQEKQDKIDEIKSEIEKQDTPTPLAKEHVKIPGKVIHSSQEVVSPKTTKPLTIFKQRQNIQKKIKPDKKKEDYTLHKLIGPIEELAKFNLESFRALAPTIDQVADKIKHKISLLQDESFEKRAQGIKAWHSSEVYKNYLELGKQSMEQGKSVQEIVKEKQSHNEPSLSFEEFEVIADLNKSLAY